MRIITNIYILFIFSHLLYIYFNIFSFAVPLWSGVNVAGVLFRDILPNVGLELDEEGWNEMFKDVIRAWVLNT